MHTKRNHLSIVLSIVVAMSTLISCTNTDDARVKELARTEFEQETINRQRVSTVDVHLVKSTGTIHGQPVCAAIGVMCWEDLKDSPDSDRIMYKKTYRYRVLFYEEMDNEWQPLYLGLFSDVPDDLSEEAIDEINALLGELREQYKEIRP